jgi:hypothetical protein
MRSTFTLIARVGSRRERIGLDRNRDQSASTSAGVAASQSPPFKVATVVVKSSRLPVDDTERLRRRRRS